MIAATRLLQHRSGRLALAALGAIGLATAVQAKEQRPLRIPNAQLEPVTFAQLDGWAEDDHAAAFRTFLLSCRAMLKGSPAKRAARPMYGALFGVCEKAVELKSPDAATAREFFEKHFRPVRIAPLGEADGFITGYYEPVVEGRRTADGEFIYPLYRKPPGLLRGGRMLGAAKIAKKGKGKVSKKRRLVPFYDRTAIEEGALKGRNLEICYLKDPIDAFFVHIQGSVRVKLQNGEMLRLNYAAANGHPYTPVGKFLIERNVITREEMSMEKIREWMTANPEEAEKLRRLNKSYVFFRETGLGEDREPIGAQGVSLTPGRSIAVDRNLHVYGTPFFLQAELPIESDAPTTRFRRLLIAQDTGGAIVGPARADIYWGAGVDAGIVAGRFKQYGKFTMLVPSTLDPFKSLRQIPLPRPRPAALVASAPDRKPAAAKASRPKPATPAPARKTVAPRKPDSRKVTPKSKQPT